jgi:hypothetical protein
VLFPVADSAELKAKARRKCFAGEPEGLPNFQRIDVGWRMDAIGGWISVALRDGNR